MQNFALRAHCAHGVPFDKQTIHLERATSNIGGQLEKTKIPTPTTPCSTPHWQVKTWVDQAFFQK